MSEISPLAPQRIIGRIAPDPNESARQYLRRVAREWSYSSPYWLMEAAGCSTGDVHRAEAIPRFACTLRLHEGEWRSLVGIRKTCEGARLICFRGKWIDLHHVAFDRAAICPLCLRQKLLEDAIWELAILSTCPIHGCYLIDCCPSCGTRLSRRRAVIHQCSCGQDLRNATPVHADLGTTSLGKQICSSLEPARFGGSDFTSACKFPEWINRLNPTELLELITFAGTVKGNKGRLVVKGRADTYKRALRRRTLTEAAAILRDWPSNFLQLLEKELPSKRIIVLSGTHPFEKLRKRMRWALSGLALESMERELTSFVIQRWQGPIRASLGWITPEVQAQLKWCTAQQAEEWTHQSQPEKLVKQKVIEGFRAGRNWWIKKASFSAWLSQRGLDRERSVSVDEATTMLGVHRDTVMYLANAGLLRIISLANDKEYLLDRTDLYRLLGAFTHHNVPAWRLGPSFESISLYAARRKFLGNREGLLSAIRAVLNGDLVPIGRSKEHTGIAAYVFRTVDLRKCAPSDSEGVKGRALYTVSETAQLLSTSNHKIRALVLANLLPTVTNSYDKRPRAIFIPQAKSRAFARKYVSTEELAKKIGMSSQSLAWGILRRNVPHLKISLGRGKGDALFVGRAYADSLDAPLPLLPKCKGFYSKRKRAGGMMNAELMPRGQGLIATEARERICKRSWPYGIAP